MTLHNVPQPVLYIYVWNPKKENHITTAVASAYNYIILFILVTIFIKVKNIYLSYTFIKIHASV